MKRRSKSEWQGLIDQYEASGLTQTKFCEENDLCVKYFGLKKKKLSQSSTTVSSSFIKLSSSSNSAQSDHLVTIRVNGVSVELPKTIGPIFVAELVKSLV